MVDLVNKGWLKVPGIRPLGDRTLEEQLLGLSPALAACEGRTVLDLGCAEGLIGREFARSRARSVLGIELLVSHLEIARKACAVEIKSGVMQFRQANLLDYIAACGDTPQQFDIVLALGVVHKMPDPAIPLRFAARVTRSLLCFRAPAYAVNGIVRGKHSQITVDAPATLRAEGLTFEQRIEGVRGEAVEYWSREG